MALFNKGQFELASGTVSDFKIDCGFLSDESIEALAYKLSTKYTFGQVFGVPTGGLRLATALNQYCSDSSDILLVEDVVTTGNSLRRYREDLIALYPDRNIINVSIFAREIVEDIESIFVMLL